MRGAEVWAVAPYSSLLSRGWAGRLGGGSAGWPGGQAGTGHATLDTAQTTPAQVAAGRDYWGEGSPPASCLHGTSSTLGLRSTVMCGASRLGGSFGPQ